jgi:hypothetical protein
MKGGEGVKIILDERDKKLLNHPSVEGQNERAF